MGGAQRYPSPHSKCQCRRMGRAQRYPSPHSKCQCRRMGGAQRYPSPHSKCQRRRMGGAQRYPSPHSKCQCRRMGGAQRYPSPHSKCQRRRMGGAQRYPSPHSKCQHAQRAAIPIPSNHKAAHWVQGDTVAWTPDRLASKGMMGIAALHPSYNYDYERRECSACEATAPRENFARRLALKCRHGQLPELLQVDDHADGRGAFHRAPGRHRRLHPVPVVLVRPVGKHRARPALRAQPVSIYRQCDAGDADTAGLAFQLYALPERARFHAGPPAHHDIHLLALRFRPRPADQLSSVPAGEELHPHPVAGRTGAVAANHQTDLMFAMRRSDRSGQG